MRLLPSFPIELCGHLTDVLAWWRVHLFRSETIHLYRISDPLLQRGGIV